MPSATDSASHIGDFDTSIPTVGTTTVSQLDDFIRHVKSVLKTDFAAVTGAVTSSHTELNLLDGVTSTTAELNYTDGVTSNIQTQLDAKAPLASPTLTGVPAAPTAAAGTNTTQVATTAFVQGEKASPTFTGTPVAPTAAAGTNTTQIATTAFVITEAKGAWDLILSQATGVGAAVDFIHGTGGVVLDSTYDEYLFVLQAVKPGTNAVSLYIRTTTDASIFDAGASDYLYQYLTQLSTTVTGAGATTTQIIVTPTILSTGQGVYGEVLLHRPATAEKTHVQWRTTHEDSSSVAPRNTIGSAWRAATANVDGVRFLWSSGNFASGTVNLYGRRK